MPKTFKKQKNSMILKKLNKSKATGKTHILKKSYDFTIWSLIWLNHFLLNNKNRNKTLKLKLVLREYLLLFVFYFKRHFSGRFGFGFGLFLFCFVLFCFVLFCFVLFVLFCLFLFCLFSLIFKNDFPTWVRAASGACCISEPRSMLWPLC